MREINIVVSANKEENKLKSEQTLVGYAGEHLATNLIFKVPEEWAAQELTYYVGFAVANGKSYKTEVMQWPVSVQLPAAVMVEGTLYIQLTAMTGDTVIKSARCQCSVGSSIDNAKEMPEDPLAGLIEQSIKEFHTAVEQLQEATVNTPYIGDNGNWYVYNTETAQYEDTGQAAKGDKGDMGTLEDGSITPAQLGEATIAMFAAAANTLQIRHVNVGGSVVPYDSYVEPAIYIISGAFVPKILFVMDKGSAYLTQLLIDTDTVRLRTRNNYNWGEWIDVIYDDTQLYAQIAALEQSMIDARPLINNQIIGQASGCPVQITDGVANTAVQRLLVKGGSITPDVQEEGTPPLSPVRVQSVTVTDTGAESMMEYMLEEELALYATPNNKYRDQYDAVSGQLTKNCEVYPMNTMVFHAYSSSADTVTCISGMRYAPGVQAYKVQNGVLSVMTINWQGMVEIRFNKADVGITATDTGAQALSKLRAYVGDSYVVAPLKTPVLTQLKKLPVVLPAQQTSVSAGEAEIGLAYQRDINSVYLDLVEYTTTLEARIAQLEIG